MTIHKAATRTERVFGRASRFLRGHGGFVWITMGAIAFGVAAIGAYSWMVIPGVLLTVVGVVVHLMLKPSYAELLDQKTSAMSQAAASATALQGALRSILTRLAIHCKINETHQRISIYCHVGENFVMLARHSASPRLESTGRGVYPADRGVIGDAWDKGESSRRDWPENREDWDKLQCALYDIPPEDVARLSMHSCSMVALRLTHDGKHVGVIVMESTEKRGVKSQQLKAAKESLLLASVCEIMYSAQPQFPEVADYLKRLASPTPRRAMRANATRA